MNPETSAGAVLMLLFLVAATVAAGAPPTSADVTRQAGTPDIEVSQETLVFSDDPYGSDTRTLTVRNVGNASLTVRTVAVVGPDRSAFVVGVDGPVELAPDEPRDVTVSFEPAAAGPRFAMLHVLSDDPDEPQRNVWLTNTRTVADVSPSRVLETKTLVDATVSDAEAGTRQSLNLSWPLTRDDGVAVDALSFVPQRDGNVTLTVATNATRFDDVPAFAPADGTEPAGFVHVDHSIANEDVANVTVTVRVRKDLLAGAETGPEDVALYRHEAGTWTELPTRAVGQGDTHYFFEARSPGLSDFATGVKRATFRMTDAVVTVTRLRTDEGTEVLVRVRNVGGADGTYAVELRLDEAVVDRRELSIAPNGTRQATFERSFDDPGTYGVSVNDRFVGIVSVVPAESTATADPGGERTGTEVDTVRSTTSESLPGFGPGAAVSALCVSTLLLALRRRR
jgi:hypothetical protein